MDQHHLITDTKAKSLNWVKLTLVILLIILIGFIYYKPQPANPDFFIQNSSINIESIPIFESQLIPKLAGVKVSHSSTFEVLPNGDLQAMWFGGSVEGARDVKIWQSIYHNNIWDNPHVVLSPEILSNQLGMYVKNLGNPVVYLAKDGALHLFVVSVGLIGGWSASRINHLISHDEGQTWTILPQLKLSAFFNLSTLVRTHPILLDDGGFYLPVYNEIYFSYPFLLRFDKAGNLIDQTILNLRGDLLQPSMVVLTQTKALAFMRNKARNDQTLYMQSTNDGGKTWSGLINTGLTNHDSSVVVAKLPNQMLLMVHNPMSREKLILSVSIDEGRTWWDIYTLDEQAGFEFSYPAIQVHGDIIDITYTWNRDNIKHVRFNLAWIQNLTHIF